ncbi:hypothetical protein BWD12_05335 [Leptospira santarosai serovar Bananal]|nr:hypothetical protein BWD11_01150 [Leptospira santarosai serovar Grippotyphosa]ONF80361.1 hypothetical protein BWD12_05335 [Leptospira santarosai serovar Bananal]
MDFFAVLRCLCSRCLEFVGNLRLEAKFSKTCYTIVVVMRNSDGCFSRIDPEKYTLDELFGDIFGRDDFRYLFGF